MFDFFPRCLHSVVYIMSMSEWRETAGCRQKLEIHNIHFCRLYIFSPTKTLAIEQEDLWMSIKLARFSKFFCGFVSFLSLMIFQRVVWLNPRCLHVIMMRRSWKLMDIPLLFKATFSRKKRGPQKKYMQ